MIDYVITNITHLAAPTFVPHECRGPNKFAIIITLTHIQICIMIDLLWHDISSLTNICLWMPGVKQNWFWVQIIARRMNLKQTLKIMGGHLCYPPTPPPPPPPPQKNGTQWLSLGWNILYSRQQIVIKRKFSLVGNIQLKFLYIVLKNSSGSISWITVFTFHINKWNVSLNKTLACTSDTMLTKMNCKSFYFLLAYISWQSSPVTRLIPFWFTGVSLQMIQITKETHPSWWQHRTTEYRTLRSWRRNSRLVRNWILINSAFHMNSSICQWQ